MKAVSRRTFALLLVSAIGTWAQQAPITAVNAAIGSPVAVVPDANGNVYFSSSFNRVFKVDQTGILTVVAGNSVAGYSGDGGPAVSAELYAPSGLVFDNAGNLYVADSANNRVRMVSPAGIITTIAGNGIQGYFGDNGPATGAELDYPTSLAIDGAGNVYILDTSFDSIPVEVAVRKVSAANGTITTVAGGENYSLADASGLAVNQAGTLYVASWFYNSILEFSPYGALLTTFSGVRGPTGLAVDPAGNLYAVDGGKVYAMSPTTGWTLVAGGGSCGCLGDGGPAVNAQLNAASIAFDSAGNLYIADSEYQRIRKVSSPLWSSPTPGSPPGTSVSAVGIITTIAGTGVPVISNVVNGASFQPGIVPNSWITILGTNLSSTTDTWANAIVSGKLPTSLDGVSVSVNGLPAYISYISPNQINAVSPDFSATGNSTGATVGVTVSAPSGTSVVFPAQGRGYCQPAFFLWPGGYAVATRQDFSWAVKNGTFPGTTTAPARPGDVIILWGAGFGPTSAGGFVPTGTLCTGVAPTSVATPLGVEIPTGTLYSTGFPVTVTVGGKAAVGYGAVLAPGYAALYQVAIQVPPSLANGDYPVIAVVDGVASPASTLLTVQQ